jgi:hypothetical protein
MQRAQHAQQHLIHSTCVRGGSYINEGVHTSVSCMHAFSHILEHTNRRAMENLARRGLTKSVGTSNFGQRRSGARVTLCIYTYTYKICMYIYTCIYTYTKLYVYIHIQNFVCTYTYTATQVYTPRRYAYAPLPATKCMHMHPFLQQNEKGHAGIHARPRTHLYIYIYKIICIYTYTKFCMYIYIYSHAGIHARPRSNEHNPFSR